MKALLAVIALALVVIAANMTYSTIHEESGRGMYETEQVVKVVGKYATQFDGMEAQLGFLVETKNGLDVVPFDRGSMAAAADAPEYLSVYWPKDQERPTVIPAAVR